MFNVPNAITIARACATPWLAWLLLSRAYGAALALFVACAFADLADGMIARRFNLRTRFGSIADPLADKLTMLTVVWLLALQDWAPVWFAVLSVARDAVIVTGAAAFHFMVGRFDMAPSWLSKFNTALEFTFLAALLALAAGLFGEGAWLRVLLYVTTATVLASGVQYVWVWGRKAAVERKGKRTPA
jgi:cardiolipin synthase